MAAATRLASAFPAARGETGLIPYLTAGYPSLDATLEMLTAFDRPGVRAVEIGIPFSDPIADGPEIQRASEWALKAGVGPAETLELVRGLRRVSQLPVVVMTYANPVLRSGIERFAREAREAGVDGIIVSDLPPDEAPDTWAALDAAGLDTVVLVAPTTDPKRLPRLVARARGFVYCLARTGVTGAGGGEAHALPERVAALRRMTPLPVAVGFGIAGASDARALKGVADAVVVGAAFMRAVTVDPARGAAHRVQTLAGELVQALS
ncbi:MAG TPA: tryptophan synthase subunit alpha [Candidatus Eisenbacteria bacterium]|nr:tryptophan synthase subunit alpha [Candidatus Eisenbacteria bacterium]